MSTSVYGIKPPDEKWISMKKVWDSCKLAGVNPPEEVLEFFDHSIPDPKGVGVVIDLDDHDCCSMYSEKMQNGLEIDVRKLPKGVFLVRFVNSF
jgi:hypothetical protein